MKTIDEITLEYCGCNPPRPIHQLNDDLGAVVRMIELSKTLEFADEDLFELCACAGIGVVACWDHDYKFCRSGGISPVKLFQDGALLGLMSEEGITIKAWAEEHLSQVRDEVKKCKTEEERMELWLVYCAAAYRYGMAFEQLVLGT